MLPFLKPKKGMTAGLIIKNRQPDEKPEENQEHSSIESAMEELSQHLAAKDFKAAAECFAEAVKLIDKEPHEEASDIEPHSYASQKED